MKDISLPRSLRGSVMRMAAVGVLRMVVVDVGVGTEAVQACRRNEEGGREGIDDDCTRGSGVGRRTECTLRFIPLAVSRVL